MINAIQCKNFTAFRQLSVTCSPGVNILIGLNGTGKTQLMKLAYAMCAALKQEWRKNAKMRHRFEEKFRGVFRPYERLGRLCRNESENASAGVSFTHEGLYEISILRGLYEIIQTQPEGDQFSGPNPIYIPTKEVLSIFPGFTSLYLEREITIDEIYFDLCRALALPRLNEIPTPVNDLIEQLSNACEGEFVLVNKQRFYYKPSTGRMLEAELAAEGFRKLGILQRLMQNGRIDPKNGGPIFWDEPEANLNPRLMKTVASVLLTLARLGQQIFIATHDYVLLKEFDLQMEKGEKLKFHSLFREETTGEIAINSTHDYLKINPNAIDDAFANLIDRDVGKSMGNLGK